MKEDIISPEITKPITMIPINQRAESGNFDQSEIFGITDDLPIILALFRKEGLQTPDNNFVALLRDGFIKTLRTYVQEPPLFLHRCN